LYARVLASYLKIPDNERRTMPIRIAHPREVHHTIKVSLPNEWTADDFSNTIDSKGFTFRSSGLYNGQTMTLRYTYKSKAGAVSGDDVQEYIRKMNEARDSDHPVQATLTTLSRRLCRWTVPPEAGGKKMGDANQAEGLNQGDPVPV
jgi:hypothetical protein